MKLFNLFYFIKSQSSKLFFYVFAKFSGLVGTALMNLLSMLEKNKEFIINLANAWFVSSFLLLLFKLFFFSFSLKINLLILLCLTFFSYIYFWYFLLQYFFILFLRKVMPKSIQIYRDSVWEDLIIEAEDFPTKKAEFEAQSTISFFEKIFLNLYIYFILLRMFLIQNSVVYFFCYLIILFSLIATKNFFFLNLFSFFVLLSKLCFFLSSNTVNEYRGCMHFFSNKALPYKIKTTKNNAIIFSYINLSLLCSHRYEYFIFTNKLDLNFIFILYVQHFMSLGLSKETAMKCEIDTST